MKTFKDKWEPYLCVAFSPLAFFSAHFDTVLSLFTFLTQCFDITCGNSWRWKSGGKFKTGGVKQIFVERSHRFLSSIRFWEIETFKRLFDVLRPFKATNHVTKNHQRKVKPVKIVCSRGENLIRKHHHDTYLILCTGLDVVKGTSILHQPISIC